MGYSIYKSPSESRIRYRDWEYVSSSLKFDSAILKAYAILDKDTHVYVIDHKTGRRQHSAGVTMEYKRIQGFEWAQPENAP
jgi:hypothetical protein